MFAALLTTLGLNLVFGNTTIQSYICQPPAKPAITSPADHSDITAGSVVFQGTATASSDVTLSMDGQPAVQVMADDYNTFKTQLAVTAGNHTIGIVSESICGNRNGSNIHLTAHAPLLPPPNSSGSAPGGGTFAALSSGGPSASAVASAAPALPLKLSISSPHDYARVQTDTVYVSGSVTQAALIRITTAGKPLAQTYGQVSSFGFAIPLNIGANVVTVVAQNGSGHASQTLHITRLPGSSSTSFSSLRPWWRTTPGIIVLSAAAGVLLLAVLIWRFVP